MPRKAKVSLSSVVSATVHPQAMDPRIKGATRRQGESILISKHGNSSTGDH